MDRPLKSPQELTSRLELAAGDRLLLVDVPEALLTVALAARADKETRVVEGRAMRTVKEPWDGVLLWREDRVGSQAVLEGVGRRVAPGGFAWVVVALRKVTGVSTPGAHRLGIEDLVRSFPPGQWVRDREIRVSAWHVAYRFARAR
ncbi:MAG: hypothetical protein ABJC07_06090 [Acidobacteriota bacterium]